MIQKTQAYKTADGTTHADLQAAQRHELLLVFKGCSDNPEQTVSIIQDKAESIIAILTTKARKPRAPKVQWTQRKRKEKAPVEDAGMGRP